MPYATVNSKKLFYTISHPTTPSSTSNTSSGTNTTSAFTLLLIHGLGSTSSFYSPILPALLTAGHTTLTLDTHGCGLSTYTGSGNSTVSIAEDALALLQHLEGQVPKNIVVVGHSMGCIVASELALRAAERVKGVVLLGPVHPNPGAAKVFEDRIKIVEETGMEQLAATVPATAVGAHASPLARAFIRTLLLQNDPTAYISLCRAIAEAKVPDYASIKAPLLIIAGDEDKSAPIEGSTKILEGYGSVRKEQKVVEGLGHWHCLEKFEEVGKLVGEFVADL